MHLQQLTSMVLSLLLSACGNLESYCPKGTHYDGEACVAGDTGVTGGEEPETDFDGDGFPQSEDCDDRDAQVSPGADEYCDGLDNDCDGVIDEDDAVDADIWYPDYDSDGYGSPDRSRTACEQPVGYVADGTDCNDLITSIHPGAHESCDGVDEDCDGEIDDDATDAGTWYGDQDGDGYGLSSDWLHACTQPGGYVSTAGDCEDTDASIYPGADELCDGVDDDCDGLVDEDDAADASDWYRDLDGDGYGDATVAVVSCEQPSSFVADDSDCDDGDSGIHPGAADDDGDGQDNDCDGDIDEDYICEYPSVDLYDTSGPVPRSFDPYYFTVSFVGTIEDSAIYDWEYDGAASSAYLGFEFFDSSGGSLCAVYYDASSSASSSGWATSSGGTLYDGYTISIRDGYGDCGTLDSGIWGATDIRDLIEHWTWGVGFGDLLDTASELQTAVGAMGGDWAADWAPYVIGGYIYSSLYAQAYEVNYALGYEAECGVVAASPLGLIELPAPSASPLPWGVWENTPLLYYFYAINLVP